MKWLCSTVEAEEQGIFVCVGQSSLRIVALKDFTWQGRESQAERTKQRGRKVELIGGRRMRLSCLSECVGGVAGMLVEKGGMDEKLMGQTG